MLSGHCNAPFSPIHNYCKINATDGTSSEDPPRHPNLEARGDDTPAHFGEEYRHDPSLARIGPSPLTFPPTPRWATLATNTKPIWVQAPGHGCNTTRSPACDIGVSAVTITKTVFETPSTFRVVTVTTTTTSSTQGVGIWVPPHPGTSQL